MNDIAVAVAKHLHLDVTRRQDVFLDQHMVIAERSRRFALARGQSVQEVLALFDQTHPLAATTGNGLDQNRITNLIGFGFQEVRLLVLAHIARRYGYARFVHQLLGGVLQAHGRDGFGQRTDPDQARIHDLLRELGILGQEAITGVDGFCPCLFGGSDDLVTDQIGFARRGRTDMHSLVSHTHMQGMGVGVRIDSHRADAHAAGRLDNTAGDFATVGDQNRFHHRITS